MSITIHKICNSKPSFKRHTTAKVKRLRHRQRHLRRWHFYRDFDPEASNAFTLPSCLYFKYILHFVSIKFSQILRQAHHFNIDNSLELDKPIQSSLIRFIHCLFEFTQWLHLILFTSISSKFYLFLKEIYSNSESSNHNENILFLSKIQAI